MPYNAYKRDHISSWRWKEIRAVIMQYDERKRRIKELIGKLPSGVVDLQKRSYDVNDPTQDDALKILRLQAINDQIDYICKLIYKGDLVRKCYGYTRAVEHGYDMSKAQYYQSKRQLFLAVDRII